MKNVKLIKYQGIWIAHVHLKDGKTGYMSLNMPFSDIEAEKFNRIETAERIRDILSLVKSPLAVEDDLLEHVLN